MSESDLDVVMVPVPKRDLVKVYEFISSLHRGETMTEDRDQTPTTPWTVAELRRFATSGSTTNITIGRVLDALADAPGTYLSTSDLEVKTGVPRANLKGSMSALTRHINKHYPGHGWMFTFRWGTHLGPDHPAEAHYALDEVAAQLWLDARR